MSTFLTSDQHFFHENIMKYCQRPFSCVGAMNEAIVSRYCEMIGPTDEVWFLGDVTFYRGDWEPLVRSLPGIKRLIVGNHDRRKMLAPLFDTVNDNITIKTCGVQFYLSHDPCDLKVPANTFHIHGHKHLKDPLNLQAGRLDVGVDGNDFRPWSTDQLMSLVGARASAMQEERRRVRRETQKSQNHEIN